MDEKPRACLRPVKPLHPESLAERRALARLESLSFDPDEAFEWPAEASEDGHKPDPALR